MMRVLWAAAVFCAVVLAVAGYGGWVAVAFWAAHWTETTTGVPAVVVFIAMVCGLPAATCAAWGAWKEWR